VCFCLIRKETLPFLISRASEWTPLAKPHSLAKAFVHEPGTVSPPHKTSRLRPALQPTPPLPAESLPAAAADEEATLDVPLPRRLRFAYGVDWDHHHNDPFGRAVAALRQRLHSESAPVTFIAAVGVFLCDYGEALEPFPWVGIMHGLPDYPEQPHVPDLHRFCTQKQWAPWRDSCRGLFTLTQLQAEFLRKHLPVPIPVTVLTYPFQPATPVAVPAAPEGREEAVLIGSYARDFPLFFRARLPPGMRKVMLAADSVMEKQRERAVAAGVEVRGRLPSEDYEVLLARSVVFMALAYDGAANTLLGECILRGTPVVCPRFSSCVESLGQDYPLYYDDGHRRSGDFVKLLTPENMDLAREHLLRLDRRRFSIEHFVRTFERSTVLQSLPPMVEPATAALAPLLGTIDLSISVCSYKRTHHLPRLLTALFDGQDFAGSIEVLVWDNNPARARHVQEICAPFLARSNARRSLRLISSSENLYCSVRLAMPVIMRSECLLICDDDVLPGLGFARFFMDAHRKHPRDILCVRGHVFHPHELNPDDPREVWVGYEHLRFVGDEGPEQSVHFAHMDAALVTRAALREAASQPMPDPTFALVDDYWLCFLASHTFGRRIRKLSTHGGKHGSAPPLTRAKDSDTPGLALHTRPEVRDARIRLYIHHMLRGWPAWADETPTPAPAEGACRGEDKIKAWGECFLGFNVSTSLQERDCIALRDLEVRHVRLGTVGVRHEREGDNDYLTRMASHPEAALEALESCLALLGKHHICATVALGDGAATVEAWQRVAEVRWHGHDGEDPSNDVRSRNICPGWLCEVVLPSDSVGVCHVTSTPTGVPAPPARGGLRPAERAGGGGGPAPRPLYGHDPRGAPLDNGPRPLQAARARGAGSGSLDANHHPADGVGPHPGPGAPGGA
jgi:hypothetical protein